ncbi:class E sortase [Agreia pratensis]|uniref:class E sortase n=1 Tax=Agreia pratensis TaxID=150121 RepID=UPI001E3E7D16|nr:class E sortase [Agreia pratensis]
MTEYQPGDIQPGSDATPLSRREARKAEADALKSSASQKQPSVPTEQPSPTAAVEPTAEAELAGVFATEPPEAGDEPSVAAGEAASVRPSKAKTTKGQPVKRTLATKVVGVFGELLITAGVFVLLFLGWQLWWNSIVLTNEQASDATSLADDWKLPQVTGTTPTPTPTQTGTPVAPVNYGEPAVMGAPSAGSDFAILYVPRFGADFKRTIAEGVDPHTVLNKGGAGHYEETQMPGEVGNFAVAAHRDGWGSAFIKINELQIGDPIYVETQDGWYTYRYRDTEYVTPYGVGVIDPVPQVEGATPVDRLITLTSCNPLYIASERIIAYGAFESWQPRSAGPPAEIASVVGSGN